ncbi:helix-turn-helix domain-containing protein [Pusillimonas sp. NJUB218]|uniref:helix-turn-helix domain-containing protein n=1 Tax=Pusillimonas sp. NJUB218 TaxID=2023230 RepID=UPI000F4C289D|nr:hypothetical protein CHR62_09265 [Pusillimonas sp. NJUB218]
MDWKKIIDDLISGGLTQAQIAKAAGVSQPTIAGLVAGHQRDMRWINGNRLLTLHGRALKSKKIKEPSHA